MPSYFFLLKYTHEGPVIDSMLDISPITQTKSLKEAVLVEKIRVKLGAPPNENVNELLRAAQMIDLRSRCDGACDGPYIVHTGSPLTREQLELVLQDKRTLNRIRNKETHETDTSSEGPEEGDRD